jgi:hypothetical protein
MTCGFEFTNEIFGFTVILNDGKFGNLLELGLDEICRESSAQTNPVCPTGRTA